MTGYDFHPEAATDLEDIWDFIANDSSAAADEVIADILDTIIRVTLGCNHLSSRRIT